MKKILMLMLLCTTAWAQDCKFNYTKEQHNMLHLAYATGLPADYGYTLAAIVSKESFVGPYIVRVNSKDGEYGSFGVGHMQLSTAMYLTNETSSWRARDKLVVKMMVDDAYALSLSLTYLLRYDHLPWKQTVARYNGSGSRAQEYAQDITHRVNKLMRCHYFGD